MTSKTSRARRLGASLLICGPLVCASLVGGLTSVASPAFAARHSDRAEVGGADCIPAALRRTLAEVQRRFGHVEVISDHRPGATISGSGRPSYHASCRAVDFNPPSGKYEQVANWLKANHSGGVGTYSCGMHHIHIDNGPNVRFHKCEGSDSHVAQRRGKGRHANAGGRRRNG